MMALHQGRSSRRFAIRLVYWQRRATVLGLISSYLDILYLMCENAILARGLPITNMGAHDLPDVYALN